MDSETECAHLQSLYNRTAVIRGVGMFVFLLSLPVLLVVFEAIEQVEEWSLEAVAFVVAGGLLFAAGAGLHAVRAWGLYLSVVFIALAAGFMLWRGVYFGGAFFALLVVGVLLPGMRRVVQCSNREKRVIEHMRKEDQSRWVTTATTLSLLALFVLSWSMLVSLD